MGTNLNVVLIGDPEQRFDPKDPQHDPERAIQIAKDLGFGDWEATGPAVLELGMSTDWGRMFITAGAHGVIVSSVATLELGFEEGTEAMERMQRLFPDSEILVLNLISSSNTFVYSVIRNGRILRVHAGDADHQVYADEGEWLPEEREILEKSEMRDGRRVFVEGGKVWHMDQMGDSLVNEVSKRFFKRGLDDLDLIELPTESFREPGPVRPPAEPPPLPVKPPWWAFWR